MEYTIISLAALAAASYFAVSVVKVDVRALLALCLVAAFFQIIFDNYMTWLGLWSFDFSKTLGIKIPIIPLENLIFGIDLAIASVASWEWLKTGKSRRSG